MHATDAALTSLPCCPPAPAPPAQVKRADVPLELEEIGLPMNTFGPKNPFTGKIISVETITGPKAGGETCHIIIQTDKKIPFVEGQSYGVIPPGTKVGAGGCWWWVVGGVMCWRRLRRAGSRALAHACCARPLQCSL